MSRRKTERLLGLVVCLLSSQRYLTAVQIRDAVPGYPESFEAFKRMFERDKEELRDLGKGFKSVKKAEKTEKIGDVECVSVTGRRVLPHPVRLFFDSKTGLLVRLIRYTETPLGRNPLQVDYANYRDTGGLKIPYQWTLTRTNGSFTIRINSVQQNVPIDEKFFVMPPVPETPHP